MNTWLCICRIISFSGKKRKKCCIIQHHNSSLTHADHSWPWQKTLNGQKGLTLSSQNIQTQNEHHIAPRWWFIFFDCFEKQKTTIKTAALTCSLIELFFFFFETLRFQLKLRFDKGQFTRLLKRNQSIRTAEWIPPS